MACVKGSAAPSLFTCSVSLVAVVVAAGPFQWVMVAVVVAAGPPLRVFVVVFSMVFLFPTFFTPY